MPFLCFSKHVKSQKKEPSKLFFFVFLSDAVSVLWTIRKQGLLSDRGFADDKMLKKRVKSFFFAFIWEKGTEIDLVKAIENFERLTQGIERFLFKYSSKLWKIHKDYFWKEIKKLLSNSQKWKR